METPPDPSSPAPESPSEPSANGSRLGRIAGHTRGLVEDVREWVDLRIDLAILEMEEKVDEAQNEIALGLLMAFLAMFATLFVLTTIALGLGWALGHPFWGFLIVSVGLLGGIGTLYRTRPELVPPSGLYQQLRGTRTASDEEANDRDGSEAEAAAEPQP